MHASSSEPSLPLLPARVTTPMLLLGTLVLLGLLGLNLIIFDPIPFLDEALMFLGLGWSVGTLLERALRLDEVVPNAAR